MRRLVVLFALVLIFGLASAGCGDKYNSKRGRGDAGVGRVNGERKDVIEFPDQFNNVSHACDGHGHRVFVTTAGTLFVLADASCGVQR